MRVALTLVLAAGCGSVANTTPDAPTGVDGSGRPDGAPGPDAACVDTVILAGGQDPGGQGWTIEQSGFAELSFPDAATTQLHTEPGGVTLGGILVLRKDNVIPAGRPFIVDVVLADVASDDHVSYDAPLALIADYTPYPGTVGERAQLVYIDKGQIGWTDDSESRPSDATAFHTYRLAIDSLGGATVSVDGLAVLHRDTFTTNGTFAIGDWTSHGFIEATSQIRSITTICP